MTTSFPAIPWLKRCYYPISSYSIYPSLYPRYFLDYLIDILLANSTNSLFSLRTQALLINDVFFIVSAGVADKFVASFAFVDAVKLEGVEMLMAELTIFCFVAFINSLVYEFFQEHVIIL